MYIYRIINTKNGKCYIGQSIQNTNKRIVEHRYKLNKGIHPNEHLQLSWNLYGKDMFDFEKIAFANTVDELDELETHYINKYRSNDRLRGYNVFSGGHHQHNVPLETRNKIGDANRGNRHTAEQKQRWAQEKRKNTYPNKIVSPCGKIYTIQNIREFCRTHNLDRGNLMKVLKKQAYHVKQWRLIDTPEEFCDNKYITYHVQSKLKGKKLRGPDGKIYIIDKPLSVFCEEHNISASKIRLVLHGKQKYHKGWYSVDEEST